MTAAAEELLARFSHDGVFSASAYENAKQQKQTSDSDRMHKIDLHEYRMNAKTRISRERIVRLDLAENRVREPHQDILLWKKENERIAA